MNPHAMPASGNAAASRSANALLSVLCFLDIREIHKSLLSAAGLGSVVMEHFPTTSPEFHRALTILKHDEKVTSETIPKMCLRITEATKTVTVAGLNAQQKLVAFNAAVTLVSASWPFLTTFNLAETERMKTVKSYMPHVVALRDTCLGFVDTEPVVPDMALCALLHEQAWLETMLTTVEDMHIGCATVGLPLARLILESHEEWVAGQPRMDEHTRLCMNQCRFEAITASILGDILTTVDKRTEWVALLDKEIKKEGLLEDKRTKPQVELLKGMTSLQCVHVAALSGASSHFQRASQQFDVWRQQGESELSWLLPKIYLALAEIHSSQYRHWPLEVLTGIVREGVQHEDLIFDDTTSIETGIVLFAVGALKYFSNPERETEMIRDALSFFERAVDVLQQTQGEEALWTLTATYRMAVCMFDLGDFDEACIHLDTINNAFARYTRQWDEERGADILLQKGRAMWKLGVTLKSIEEPSLVTETEADELISDACEIFWDVCGFRYTPPNMTDSVWDSRILPLYR